MEQNCSSEADSHSASHEIPAFYGTEFHYRVQKDPPVVPILVQMHPVHTFPHSFL
jgi:hypothetical protein